MTRILLHVRRILAVGVASLVVAGGVVVLPSPGATAAPLAMTGAKLIAECATPSAGASGRITVQVASSRNVVVGRRIRVVVRYRCLRAGQSVPVADLRVDAASSPERIAHLASRAKVTGSEGVVVYDIAAIAPGRAVVHFGVPAAVGCPRRGHGAQRVRRRWCAISVRVIAVRLPAARRITASLRPLATPLSNATPLAIPPAGCSETANGRPAFDQSTACSSSVLAAIDVARAREGVRAMVLPRNWSSITPAEQLFVLADLERVDRGLPPYVGLSPQLDAVATQAAIAGVDPVWSSPLAASEASNWAGNEVTTLAADYDWVYNDGFGSANVDCTSQGASGCWGHRGVVLGVYTGLGCTDCVMGTAAVAGIGGKWATSLAEIVVAPVHPGALPVVFTWARDVLPYLASRVG